MRRMLRAIGVALSCEKALLAGGRIIGCLFFSKSLFDVQGYLKALIITTSRLIVPREHARVRPSRDQA